MRVFIIALFSLCFTYSFAQKEVKLEELKDHIGDIVKVKGKIFGARYLETAKNTPTFINDGGAYPTQLLPIVIGGDVRKKLGYDSSDRKNVVGIAVVTGKVKLFRDKAQGYALHKYCQKLLGMEFSP